MKGRPCSETTSMTFRMPADASSLTKWTIAGSFPKGKSSFGITLLAGHILVAEPAAAITAVSMSRTQFNTTTAAAHAIRTG